PFYDSQYQEDQWRIATVAPESEIFAVLRDTDTAVNQELTRVLQRSIGIAIFFALIFLVISIQMARSATSDLQTLSTAAEKVAAKEYDVDIQLKSTDEIGRLGLAFTTMTKEIRDYT